VKLEKALALVDSIVATHLEMVRAECGARGEQAISETVADLKGLVKEIFADHGEDLTLEATEYGGRSRRGH